MKYIIAALVTLAFASSHIVADTIEYRVFSIRGHLPPEVEFLRLFENKLITPIISRSVAISENGQFKDEEINIITQATGFDADANITDTQEVETGFRFAGSVSSKDDIYEVSFNFQHTRLVADVIYPHRNGQGMPQPLFERMEAESAIVTALSDRWTTLGGILNKEENNLVFVFRIKK